MALKVVFNKNFSLKIQSTNLYVVGLTTSFDFNPHGETAATIDCRGTCSISDVNTNNSSFRHKMEMILFNGKSKIKIFF